MGIWHRFSTATGAHARRPHRSSQRTTQLGRRALGLEPLECRQLLSASVGMRFEFDTPDPGGAPVSSLSVGQNYILKAFVQDIRDPNPVPPGVRQAYFNIAFDAGVASVNGAITHGADFNLNTDGTSGSGTLTNIGGQDTDQAPPAAAAEEFLFSVPLHIDGAGSLTLVPSLTADSLKQVLHFDSAAVVSLEDINFTLNGSASLSITAVPGPSVSSIDPTDPPTTNLTTVHYAVTFSELVDGVDLSDFELVASGVTATISSVSPPSGLNATYNVTVTNVSGNGTLALKVKDDDTIMNATDQPLGGTGAGNGDFTGTPPYIIDQTVTVSVTPVVITPGNQTSLTVSGTGEVGASISLVITDVGAAHTITPPPTTVLADGTWSISGIDASGLNDGTITYAATANDAAGNSTTDTKTSNKDTLSNAPGGTDKTVTTPEDTAYTFTAPDFGFSDPNDSPPNNFLAVQITTLPSAGSLTNDGAAVVQDQFILVADITDGKLKFTPAANANGTGYATFDFKVQDDGGTTGGGQDTDPSANTITVDVTSVNDEPSGADNTVVTVLNTDYVFELVDFGFSDPNDTPANSLLAVKIASLPDVGTLTNNGAGVTIGQLISAADIAVGLFKFTPDTGEIGTPYTTFAFQVQDNGETEGGGQDTDQSANLVTINVTLPNQAPSGTDKTVSTLEDTAYTFTVGDFGFSDPNDTPADLFAGVVITTVPAAGTLANGGAAVVTGQFISLAEIQAGKLTYTPAANANGAGIASFTFQVRDDGGTAGGGQDTDQSPNTISVDVNALDDAPSGADNTVTTNEDTDYTFLEGDFIFSDPNDSPPNEFVGVVITTLPTAGTLINDGSAVIAGQFVLLADIQLGKLKFTPAANANGLSYATFTFQVRDNGDNEGGSINTDPSPNTMTIDVTALNDEPSGADKSVSTVQNTSYTFTATDFNFGISDPNDTPANTLQAVKITTLPALGSLTLSGAAVAAGQFISVADIQAGNFKFVPGPGAPASPFATFTFQVQDNGGNDGGGQDTDQSPNTMTINVTAPDTTAPAVLSINRVESDPTNLLVVHFTVTFSENVTGVDLNDFQLVKPGEGNSIAGEFKASISGSGSTYTVEVHTGVGNGLLGLNLVDDNSITDAANNALGGAATGDGNFTGQQFTIDRVPPTVGSIFADLPNPTTANTATFTVQFNSGPVTGVDISDFQLIPSSGITGASIISVTGSLSNYTVTINTGTGTGTIALKLVDDDTIVDSAGNRLGGADPGNGDFTGNPPLAVDRDPPTVLSINRVSENPATTATVQFTVTFSETVTGVDAADFTVVPGGGVTGAAVTSVSGSGSTYTVTVNTGSGNGTLGLNLVDDDSIVDAASLPLGGTGIANGNFTGQVYTIARTNGISGFVYVDSNGNGARDSGDVDLEGVLVTLYGTGNQNSSIPTRTTLTLSDGSYSFTDLVLGTYTVVESQPGKFKEGVTTAGNLGGSVSGNTISGIVIAADSNGTNYNFGDTLPVQLVSINFFLASTPPIGQLYSNLVASARTVGPLATSFTRLDPNPTTTSSTARFLVTFDYDVTGVDTGDFFVSPGAGTSGGSVASVSGSGKTYTVTVNTGSTAGTLQLALGDDDSIKDGSGTPLGNVGAGTGNFFSEIYTVNQPATLASSLVDQALADGEDLGDPNQ